MQYNGINPLLHVKALKNLYFLRVITSLLAKGSGDRVRKGSDRVSGAIIKG